jgi:site-specific DNA recombinase
LTEILNMERMKAKTRAKCFHNQMHEVSSIERVALYARVSSEEQREGQTIDSQIAELQRHAKEHSWIVTGIYKDDGWSGGLLARPDLDRLRDHASKSLFEAVLVNDVDRLARDVAHLGVIKRSFERSGVQLIFRKLPSESSPMRNLMVNILGSFAEFEKELIADRTRRGRRHKTEVRQEFIGCLAPFGYDYIEKGASQGQGLLRVNEEEALIVKRMYAWVDKEALSARRVVQRLSQTGLHPRKGATKWAKSSVLRVLRNQTYAGVWHYNKHESFEPLHQNRPQKYRRSVKTSLRLRDHADWIAVPLPENLWLVSPDRWKRVQDQLNRNISFSPRNARHPYLLRGLVRCAGCQARFVGDPSHQRFYYRCHRRCKRVGTILESRLDDAVWNALEEAILNPELILKSVLAVQARHTVHDVGDNAVASVSKVLEQLRSEEVRILEAYRRAIISADQLAEELQKLASRRKAAEVHTDASGEQRQPAVLSEDEVKQRISEFCKQVANRLACLTTEEKQSLLRLVVEEVVFDGASIRIRGIIPARDEPDETAPLGQRPDLDGQVGQSIGRIENITPCSRDPNPANDGRIETTTPHPCGRNLAGNDGAEEQERRVFFEISHLVEKQVSWVATTARRANLIKANRALQEGRLSKPDTRPPKPQMF